MRQIKLLVLEDDASLQKFLVSTLRRHLYQVVSASTGSEALLLFKSHNPDIVLLDMGLPDVDGLFVLKEIRKNSQAAILVLSARNQEVQKAQALDAGADDYLTKPFGVVELTARLRVASRRILRQSNIGSSITTGDLRVDLDGRKVTIKGEAIHLTQLEYRILAALASRVGRVTTHQQLLSEIWGATQVDQTQYLHVHVSQLRRKIEEDSKRPKYIKTESGIGYRLEDIDCCDTLVRLPHAEDE
jgi:two-component system KDP operon response regulator KdpE